MGVYQKILDRKKSTQVDDEPTGTARLIESLIVLDFKQTLEVVQKVKRLTMRKYHNGQWTAALTYENIVALEREGFVLSGDLVKWKNKLLAPVEFDPTFAPQGLKHSLAIYQHEAIQTIDKWNGRALLADEQGLGKTAEALGWVAHRGAYPCLIICPSFAKYNWKNEIKYWVAGEPPVQVLEGLAPTEITSDKFVIANYDILSSTVNGEDIVRDDVWSIDWKTVIIDEAHYISNNDAIRTWAVKTICTGIQVPHVLTISATPGRVRPAQIFTSINLVNPQVFPSFFKYAHRYCGAKRGYSGQWEFKGSENEAELYDLLTKSVMIRRRKVDLFDKLPPKIRRPVILPGFEEKQSLKGLSLGGIEKAKQAAVKKKMPHVLKWIENFLQVEDKLIVFGEHKEVLDAIMDNFGDVAVRVDGSKSAKEKDEAIHKFQRCAHCGERKERHTQNGCKYEPDMSVRLFVGSSAAKEAATLTAATNVAFVELWWSMNDHEQAEDRSYWRVSDPHGITSWYLIAANSIEEDIAELISFRDKKIKMVMNGEEVDKNSVLSYLIRKHKREDSHAKD